MCPNLKCSWKGVQWSLDRILNELCFPRSLQIVTNSENLKCKYLGLYIIVFSKYQEKNQLLDKLKQGFWIFKNIFSYFSSFPSVLFYSKHHKLNYLKFSEKIGNSYLNVAQSAYIWNKSAESLWIKKSPNKQILGGCRTLKLPDRVPQFVKLQTSSHTEFF